MIVAHSDASYSYPIATTGYVLRDENGALLERDTQVFDTLEHDDYNSMAAELRAMVSAARAALDYDSEKIIFYTDCNPVADHIARDEAFPQVGTDLHAFKSLANRFDEYHVVWLNRSENEAHEEVERVARPLRGGA